MTYRVVIERDESGAWLASVPSVPGCHTYGRTLEQARARIGEALDLWVDDAEEHGLRYAIRLPADIRNELRRARAARLKSDRARGEASRAVTHAARELTARLGLSLRDSAELLELSHQRVQQLLADSG